MDPVSKDDVGHAPVRWGAELDLASVFLLKALEYCFSLLFVEIDEFGRSHNFEPVSRICRQDTSIGAFVSEDHRRGNSEERNIHFFTGKRLDDARSGVEPLYCDLCRDVLVVALAPSRSVAYSDILERTRE